MCVLAWVYISHMQESTEAGEDIRYPGTRGVDNCEPSSRYLEPNSGPLQVQ